MDRVVAASAASAPKVFAKNVMEIAVPPSNPGKGAALNSLASPSVKTALCQPQVPCGATAAKVFTNAKITVKPVTLEPDVRAVLSNLVVTGEGALRSADRGFEEAAATLGAKRMTVFRRITVPLVAPSLGATDQPLPPYALDL